MSKRSRRSVPNHHAQPRRATSTYVALVHGIGEKTAEDWARKSLLPLVSWWTNTVGQRATLVGCGHDCSCKGVTQHKHVLLRGGTGDVRVDVASIYWADVAHRPRWVRTAALAFEATLLVGLVDLSAAAIRLVRAPSLLRPPGTLGSEVEMARWLWGVFVLLARAFVMPFLAPLAFTLALLVPSWNRRLGDAFAWATDYQGSRSAIAQKLRGQIAPHLPAGPVVLVGHSQGGAIIASLECEFRARGGDVTTVTLGTGQALLAALAQSRRGWPLWRSAVLWPPIVICAFGLAVFIVALASSLLVAPFVALSVMIADFGGSIWQIDKPPYTTVLPIDLRSFPHAPWWEKGTGAFEALRRAADLLPLGAAFAVLGGITAALAAAMIGIRARELKTATQSDANGIDIIATHDPVSAAMLELGEGPRLKHVDQTTSLVRDHMSYFQNGCSSLPLVVGAIEKASGIECTDEGHRRAAYLRSGLLLRRCTRPIVVCGTFVCVVVAVGKANRLGGLIAATACSIVAWAGVTLSCVKWLETASRKAQDRAEVPGLEYLAIWQRVPRRRRVHDLLWVAGLAAAGAVLLGGGVVVLSQSTLAYVTPEVFCYNLLGIGSLSSWQLLSGGAGLVGLGFAVSAWLSIFGVPWAAWSGAGCYAVGTLIWAAHGTVTGGTIAAIWLALTAIGVRRARKERRS